MMQFLFLLIMMNSSIFFFLNHPLSMGLSLMMQTILITLSISIFSFSFWFSYILFLIFMGGMLILFMYMTSLASNEMYNFNFKKKNLIFLLFFIIFTYLMINFQNIKEKIINNDILNLNILIKLNMKNENLMLNKMMNFPINLLNTMMIIYLFITLIASVKISNIFKGPLRSKLKK